MLTQHVQPLDLINYGSGRQRAIDGSIMSNLVRKVNRSWRWNADFSSYRLSWFTCEIEGLYTVTRLRVCMCVCACANSIPLTNPCCVSVSSVN